jgi:hypothetical protein
VAASVLAVLATLTVPHWLSGQAEAGPGVPQPPTPSRAPDSPGTRTWQAVTCAQRVEDACAAPASIDHAGLLLHSVGGRRTVWSEDHGTAPTVRMQVPRSNGARWVLVGGRFTGARTRLSVRIGTARPVEVPTDRLSLFALRGRRTTTILVSDLGEPRDGELLRIEEYTQR